MKLSYIVIGIILVLVIYCFISRTSEIKRIESNENAYIDLRRMVLTLQTESLGLEIKDTKKSLCSIMEWEISNATVTLVSVIDGSTSLYLSTGGGIIGGGADKNVVDASSAFREESERHLHLMKKDVEFVLPQKGHVCFYVVTTDGVYKYDGTEKEMVNGKDEFSKVFMYGQNTITELRKLIQ